MRKNITALLSGILLAGAGLLGGCSNTTDTPTSSEADASGIVGDWQMAGYEDASQSFDAEELASYGYASVLTVNSDGTLELDGFPGTWEEDSEGEYVFTVDSGTSESEESSSQSDAQSAEMSTDTVFTVSYENEKLNLGIEEANWIFERATASSTQSQ